MTRFLRATGRTERSGRAARGQTGPERAALLAAALTAALASGSAAAQSRTTPFGGFQHDTTRPVEVSSDQLEVRNADQKAIFTGNVRVRQGGVLMKADWLEVTYANRARGAMKASASDPLGGGGAIDRLRARGEVIISNGAETARSREADYDVASAAIILTGDVILLQGKNVLKGEKLRIDLTNGSAKMIGGGRGASSGRVRVQLDPAASRQ